jgi:hypothetical protein
MAAITKNKISSNGQKLLYFKPESAQIGTVGKSSKFIKKSRNIC